MPKLDARNALKSSAFGLRQQAKLKGVTGDLNKVVERDDQNSWKSRPVTLAAPRHSRQSISDKDDTRSGKGSAGKGIKGMIRDH